MPDYRIGGARGLPLDADHPFDRQAAADSVFEWAGGDDFDPAKARRGFVVYEAGREKLRTGYHLPFARAVEGTLKAVPNGVRNAKSRLPQLGGVSQEVIDRGNALLDSYMERIHEEADGGDGRAASAGPVVTFEHHIRAVGRAQTGHSREELLSRAELRAPDPSVFDENAPFFWSVDGSSNKTDALGTRMQVSTLRNYAADAEDGVAFLRVHNEHQLNFGWSLAGKFTGGQGNGIARMAADFFTLRDIELEGLQTNAFIQLARAGIAHDVSVAFYDGRMMCSLSFCGKRMMDFRGMLATLANGDDGEFCWHVPLVEYAVPDQKGKPTGRREVALGLIEDSRLSHIGWVPDGATPGASLTATRNVAVLKARQAADAHKLDPEQARMFESHHRGLRLPSYHNWPGYRPPVDADGRSHVDEEPAPPVVAEGDNDDGEPVSPPQEAPMGDIQIPEAALRAFRSLVPKERIPVEADATAVVEAATTHVRELQERLTTRDQVCKDIAQVLNEAGCTEAEIGPGVRWLLAENKRLTPLADVGRTYRADLIEDTLKEGVAADGNAFAREMWSGVLGRASLEEIKAIRSTFTAKADAKAGGGGRKIDDQPGNPPKVGDDDERTNMRAFRVRAG